MELLITHLTRMKYPYICVAGVDHRATHIRPVLTSSPIGRAALHSQGGPFAIGSVVHIENPRPRPVRPEVEDVVFHPRRIHHLRTAQPPDFLTSLRSTVQDDLSEVFGGDLERLSGTAAAVPRGKGRASLGVLHVRGAELVVERHSGVADGVRLAFTDPVLGRLRLKVTDLRLWNGDHTTVDLDATRRVGGLLSDCLVAVGLTRAHEVSSYPGARHWVQVNNIHPISDPYWRTE